MAARRQGVEALAAAAVAFLAGAAALVLAPRPAAAVCDPVVQWVWDGTTRAPAKPDTCITPLVVQLTDDNSDGTVDAWDSPDVVFTHCAECVCVITAVDGRTGSDIFTTTQPTVLPSGLAAGDIDRDGFYEILAVHSDRNRLVCFDHTGSLKWTGDPFPALDSDWGSPPGLADLDQDGTPEIYHGSSVFNFDGTSRWNGTGGSGFALGWSLTISNAADLDAGSPGLELLAGDTLYDANGNVLWQVGAPQDGWTAVADMDGNGAPEIVLTTSQGIYILNTLGVLLRDYYHAGGFPAQPVIDDLDGDGVLEVLRISRYVTEAFRFAGRLAFDKIWEQRNDDRTGLNGACTFDFDGDGKSEVVYHDEVNWVIMDGSSGAIVFQEAFPSGTRIETPVVADIDGDCKTEILISSCMRGYRLVAYECANAVTARPIWNQFQYHVTNVADDGTIPRYEVPPWTAHNSWLGQVETETRVSAGEDVTLCRGDAVVLDGSSSSVCCPGGPLFRWSESGNVVCDWASVRTCPAAPIDTTVYTLEVACGDDPSRTPLGVSNIAVNVRPRGTPADIGNTVRLTRSGAAMDLTWAADANATTYNVYRSEMKDPWPPDSYLPGVPSSQVNLDSVSDPGDTYFYRATGVSCTGAEGPGKP